jgi:pimeloyl-ACP methyl ester carboxylesterase
LDASLETRLAQPSPPIAFDPLDTLGEAAERIRHGEIDEGLAPAIDVWDGPGSWEGMPEQGKQILRDNARTLLGQINEQRAPFSNADAEAIRAPTLLIAGERSPAGYHRILDGLQTALRDVRRVVIPAASHPPNRDNPRDFERQALAFFKDR